MSIASKKPLRFMHNVLRGVIVSFVVFAYVLFPATSFAEPAVVQNSDEKTVPAAPPEPLTIAPEPKHYDIVGTIAVPAAHFTITVDGEAITTLEGDGGQPIIAEQPSDDGTYAWGYAVPERFAAGEHKIVVSAVIRNELGDIIRQFKEVQAALLLVVPPVVPPVTTPPGETPPVDDTTLPVVPIVTAPLPLAPEIGQFVAPMIDENVAPGQSTTKKTELYGVPVNDLLPAVPTSGNSPAQKTRLNRTTVAPHASPVIDQGAASSQSSGMSIEATQHGWHIFGVSWYWVMMTCLSLCLGIGFIIRAIAPRVRVAASTAWTTLRV